MSGGFDIKGNIDVAPVVLVHGGAGKYILCMYCTVWRRMGKYILYMYCTACGGADNYIL